MSKQSDEVVVHNNRRGTLTLPGMRQLKPGANKVTRVELNEMRKQTTRRDGTSSVPANMLTVDDDAPATTLGRPVADAVSLVKDTFDLDLLKQWGDEDDRTSVRKAVNDQVDLLTKEPDEDEDEGNDEE